MNKDVVLRITTVLKILHHNMAKAYWKNQKQHHCGNVYDSELCLDCRHEPHCNQSSQILEAIQYVEDRT